MVYNALFLHQVRLTFASSIVGYSLSVWLQARFCVFTGFSDGIRYPERKTKRKRKLLFDVLWNGCDLDD